jgi:hypothetical protein
LVWLTGWSRKEKLLASGLAIFLAVASVTGAIRIVSAHQATNYQPPPAPSLSPTGQPPVVKTPPPGPTTVRIDMDTAMAKVKAAWQASVITCDTAGTVDLPPETTIPCRYEAANGVRGAFQITVHGDGSYTWTAGVPDATPTPLAPQYANWGSALLQVTITFHDQTGLYWVNSTCDKFLFDPAHQTDRVPFDYDCTYLASKEDPSQGAVHAEYTGTAHVRFSAAGSFAWTFSGPVPRETPAPTTGTLNVWADWGEVFVDGVDRGSSCPAPHTSCRSLVLTVASGNHTVVARAPSDGHVCWTRQISVPGGGYSTIDDNTYCR